MSKLRMIITNGDKVYAVPVEVIEQHAIDTAQLESAQALLADESDVTGQGSYMNGVVTNDYGQAWVREDGQYKRAPWHDRRPSTNSGGGYPLIEY